MASSCDTTTGAPDSAKTIDGEHKFNINNVNRAIEEESKVPPLTDEQLRAAKQDLVVKYPKVKRHLVDPPFSAKSKKQKYGMFSWYPSRGAKPDVNGVYGVIILRGCEKKEEDLEARATYLIQNVDSKHEYLIAEVGAEKPLSAEAAHATDIKLVEANVDEARKQRDEQLEKEKEEARKQIEEKKRALYEDVKKDPNTIDLDYYATKKSKLANVRQHYEDQLRELVKSRDIISKTRQEIIELDQSHPEFKDQFLAKMKATMEQNGIAVDWNKMVKYMEVGGGGELTLTPPQDPPNATR